MTPQNALYAEQDSRLSDPSRILTSKLEIPPLAPPLPPPHTIAASQRTLNHEQHIKLKMEVSPFIKKLQAASVGYEFESQNSSSSVEPRMSPTGWYFVYGTLMDTGLLAEVLDLNIPPKLRPARIAGYNLRLWGQYPALVDGQPGEEIYGMAFEVDNQRHAERLAEYETRAYRARPCILQFNDSSEQEQVGGFTFMYNGNSMDLDNGHFDLQLWLQRVGRVHKSLPS